MPDTAESLRCRGMRDLLPPEMARFRRVERAFLAACRASGYEEVRTPTIEYLHLFTAAGTLSPQMLHRVYSFLDWDGWSGERVVLRPEATIPTARLYSERLSGPARLCYVQNVFRFAGDDQSREDWQCGVELIGAGGPPADLELILLGLSALGALGLGDAEVVLSHAGLVRAVLARAGLTPEGQSASYDRLLDGDLSVIGEVEARLPELDAPLHLLFDVSGAGSGYLANVREALLPALPELEPPLSELATLVQVLEGLGRTCRLQAALARSFEYYSGPVFRFFIGDEDVGGGGRYDELLGLLGGSPTPASGFVLYANVLARLLPEAESDDVAAVLVRPSDDRADGLAAALRLAQGLRDRGIACALALDGEAADRQVQMQADGRLLVRLGEIERPVDGVAQAASLLGGRS
ncbi:MAG: ATP phosphoribosyltransferase regulatory subunit [Dehalococcoidia bacterium]